MSDGDNRAEGIGYPEGCDFCNQRSVVWGNDGTFSIAKHTTHMIDGSTRECMGLHYDAESDVFGTSVELQDFMDINFCPMCGRRLS